MVVSATLSIVLLGDAFAPSQMLPRSSRSNHNGFLQLDQCALQAASGDKKKRRRRKQPPGAPVNPETSSISEPAISVEELASADDLDDDDEVDVSMLKDIAKFKFDGQVLGPESTENTDSEGDNTALPLPDIKDTLRKKELEEEMARIEEEEAETRVKIKRSDRKAMSKVSSPLFGFLVRLNFSHIWLLRSCWSKIHMPMPMTPSLRRKNMEL